MQRARRAKECAHICWSSSRSSSSSSPCRSHSASWSRLYRCFTICPPHPPCICRHHPPCICPPHSHCICPLHLSDSLVTTLKSLEALPKSESYFPPQSYVTWAQIFGGILQVLYSTATLAYPTAYSCFNVLLMPSQH